MKNLLLASAMIGLFYNTVAIAQDKKLRVYPAI